MAVRHLNIGRKMKTKNLETYLINYGYNPEDAQKSARVFKNTKSPKRAAMTFKWADDRDHDYSGEMFNVIHKFLNA